MIAHLAVGTRTARARARIHAVAIATGHITATLAMVEALGAATVADRIAAVAVRTRAHRTSTDRLLTQGIQAARIARTALGCTHARTKKHSKRVNLLVIFRSRMELGLAYAQHVTTLLCESLLITLIICGTVPVNNTSISIPGNVTTSTTATAAVARADIVDAIATGGRHIVRVVGGGGVGGDAAADTRRLNVNDTFLRNVRRSIG